MTQTRESFSTTFFAGLKKDPKTIARLRLAVLNARGKERDHFRRLFADGADGFLCWLNLACWTYYPLGDRTPMPPWGHGKHLPFVTWPIQDASGRALWRAIDQGENILFDKSRDMGATWLNIAALAWWFLFVPDTPLLMASRVEDYVDKRGNPKTLFWKLDYLIARQPQWLIPATTRTYMHLANLDNGSVIDGESTNPDLGRGDRRKAILLDEFASVEDGKAILSATADVSPCRIFNSTPKGRGNAFADVRFSGKVPVITLHWKDHPVKGAEAREITDPATGKRKWTSPWYEGECGKRTSRREIAQEIDIDYLASGSMVFDTEVLNRIRATDIRPPDARGELTFEVFTREEAVSYRLDNLLWQPEGGRRRLALWCPLIDGKPRQDRNYVAFADISLGMGASNSVIDIVEKNSREQVAQFCCPDTSPDDLAKYAVALCRWFGGQEAGQVFLGWEANGPGGPFGRMVQRLGYGFILHTKNLDVGHEPEDRKMGWHSSKRNKELLLGDLRGSMARGEIVIHCEPTIVEAEQYIYYPSGSIGPSKLNTETEGARAAHGDRVIAVAGCVLCLGEQPKAKPPPQTVPPDSFAGRRRVYERQKRQANQW